MTITELLTQPAKDAHQVFLGAIDGLTDDQANYQPAGTALSVAATWVHHAKRWLHACHYRPSAPRINPLYQQNRLY